MGVSSSYAKTCILMYCSCVVCYMFSIQGLDQTVYAYVFVGLFCDEGTFQACRMTLGLVSLYLLLLV